MSTGGRPSKGDRYAGRATLSRRVAEAVWAIHDETGATVSDIVARFVALGLEMPEYAPELPAPLIAAEASFRRPLKGDTYSAKTRLPRPVADAVWATHHSTGAAISDIIARCVAMELNLPQEAPALPGAIEQEELQLKTA